LLCRESCLPGQVDDVILQPVTFPARRAYLLAIRG
jgi:hypothetical protein